MILAKCEETHSCILVTRIQYLEISWVVATKYEIFIDIILVVRLNKSTNFIGQKHHCITSTTVGILAREMVRLHSIRKLVIGQDFHLADKVTYDYVLACLFAIQLGRVG